MEIIRIEGELPADIATLAPFAAAEGIGIIDTLIAEWASGENRFTGPGEMLYIARVDGCLAGTGGLTHDYNFPDALRMRRFYVHPDFRRHGVARALAECVIGEARAHATWLTCHTGTDSGRRFWERMGFVPVGLDTHTHEARLS
jgi:GNAT superfamily N-acetyltransferase